MPIPSPVTIARTTTPQITAYRPRVAFASGTCCHCELTVTCISRYTSETVQANAKVTIVSEWVLSNRQTSTICLYSAIHVGCCRGNHWMYCKPSCYTIHTI